MTSPRPSPAAARQDRPGAIVEAVRAAVERLTADGTSFTDLRVEHIAKEAGIARSTFYLRFRDKTTLLCTLAGAVGEDVFAEVDEWLHPSPLTCESAGEAGRVLHRGTLAYVAIGTTG